MSVLVERALLPLDTLRRGVARGLIAQPALRRTLVRRELRIPRLLALHGVLAFGLALWVPSLPLLLAPIVLGVPHVAADIRYLVLRRQLPTSFRNAVWLLAAALVALRVVEETHVLRASPILAEHALGALWLLLAAAAGTHRGGLHHRSVLVCVAAASISLLALAFPTQFRLVFLHGHNLIAVLIWLLVFRRSLRGALLPLLLILAGAAVLASGAFLHVTLHHGALSVFGLHLLAVTDWLAPGLPAAQAIALTISFAYLQSIHYAIWLIAIPQQDGTAQGSTTFRMAFRGFVRDLGVPAAAAICGLTALVMIAGTVSPVVTRNLYLSLAGFHAWLELALLAFLLARDRPAAQRSSSRA